MSQDEKKNLYTVKAKVTTPSAATQEQLIMFKKDFNPQDVLNFLFNEV